MSQQEKILYHLSSGHSITPLEALEKFGCFRLSSVIHRLKKDFDLDIITIMKEKYDEEQGVKSVNKGGQHEPTREDFIPPIKRRANYTAYRP